MPHTRKLMKHSGDVHPPEVEPELDTRMEDEDSNDEGVAAARVRSRTAFYILAATLQLSR